MASGFNGQSFAFHGYLPIQGAERTKRIKQLEQRIYNEHQTQIFIETPYRNAAMIDELTRTLKPQTKLCVASGITTEQEWIKTLTIQEWRKVSKPDLSKIPTIYLIYK
jgi:16S rRNA (cytidine1402-2'-O)-methyltransferase